MSQIFTGDEAWKKGFALLGKPIDRGSKTRVVAIDHADDDMGIEQQSHGPVGSGLSRKSSGKGASKSWAT